jgi:transketolase
MRAAFVRTLLELAEADGRIVLLTGDLGFSVLEPFAEHFPRRFFNVGVAEQNLIGLATGLAEAGLVPFAYSIATFAALRPYEFIRNGPVHHRLPVRIVGVGGGFEYGAAGPTHHGLEDVGVLRLQPGLTVLAPADGEQAAACLRATWDRPGPVYYRLGKDDRALVPELGGRFALGRVELVRPGRDLLMLALGPVAVEAVAAAEALAVKGLACAVGVVAAVSPPPRQALARLLRRFPAVLTVEAHYLAGGLGSLVAETIAERGLRCRLVRCGVKRPLPGTGSQAFLERRHGLHREALAEQALAALASAGARRRRTAT